MSSRLRIARCKRRLDTQSEIALSQQPTRRDIVAGGTAALLATNATAAPALQTGTGAQTVTGIVTEIVLDGGPAQARGPAVAGVLVSNGRDGTRTDATGRYTLPIEPGRAIFIIKPAGYSLPVAAATRMPLFSYVHDPDGTPADLAFRYRGMPPTGALPASVDFQLTRVPEPETFDVILFTDPQPQSSA